MEKTYELEVRVTKTLTAENLADVITAAIEGGINYWASVRVYKWENLPFEDVHAVIHDSQDDGKEYSVTVATIYQGLKSILEGSVKYNVGEGPSVLAMAQAFVLSGDAGDVDAGDADNIVQAGLFSELKYGG